MEAIQHVTAPLHEIFRYQMDYLYFTEGLIVLLLSVVVNSLRKYSASEIRWMPLMLFFLGQGIGFWIYVVTYVFAGITQHTIFCIASYFILGILLVEFARRNWAVLGRKSSSPSVHAVLIILSLLGLLAGTQGLMVSVRYVFGTVGALWTAAVFLEAIPEKLENAPRARGLAGFSLAYLLIVAWIPVSAPFFPATVINLDNVFELIGIPVPLIRIILEIGLLVSLLNYYWLLQKAVRTRYIGLWANYREYLFPLAIGIFVIAGWGLTQWFGNDHEKAKHLQIRHQAQLAAAMIDPALIQDFAWADGDQDQEAYQTLRRLLRSIQESCGDIESVYLVGEKNAELIFGPDSLMPGEYGYTEGPLAYEIPPEELPLVFASGQSSVAGPYEDEWGVYESAFVPIYDQSREEVVAVLGLDIDASGWEKPYYASRLPAIMMVLLISLLILAFLLNSQRLSRYTRQIRLSEHNLAVSQKIAHIGSWVSSLETGATSWSDELYKILGVNPEDGPLPVEQMSKILQEDQAGLFADFYHRVRSTGELAEIELSILQPGKEESYVHVIGDLVSDEGSQAGEIVLTLQDVTRIKQTEDEVRKLNLELESRVESRTAELEQAVRELNQAAEERERTEKLLVESEERYRHIFNNNHSVMILLEPDTLQIVEANPAACQFYGYTHSEIIAMKVNQINIFSIPEIQAEVQAARREERNQFYFKHRLANGDIRDVEVFSGPVAISGRQLLFSVIHDITERRRAEAQLVEEHNRSQLYLDIAGVMIIILDRDFRVSLINRHGLNILGLDEEDVIGKNWFECFVPLPEREYIRTHFSLWVEDPGEGDIYSSSINPIVNSAGERRMISWHNTLIFDSKGRVTSSLSSGEDITDLIVAQRQAQELSLTDDLTGLYNRRGFMTLGVQQLKIAERLGRRLIVIYVDLDGMKWINDNLGHMEGDQALKDAAVILRRSYRASDVVARIGGDEFVGVALENDEIDTGQLIKRLNENINAFNMDGGRPYKLSFSVGAAVYEPGGDCSLENLLEQADALMYKHKQSKK